MYSTNCRALGRENGLHFGSNCLSNFTCQPYLVDTNLSRLVDDIERKKIDNLKNKQ